MKILFTRFPLESRMGGAEIQTLSLMKGFRARGHDVEFLGSCETLLREAASCELRAASLHIGAPPVTKWHAISFFWRKREMKKKLIAHSSQLAPGVVFMLSLTEKLLLTEELAKRGVKVFWVEHDRVGRWLTRNPWLPLLKRQSQHATIITVSDLSKKLYEKIGFDPSRVIAIPNGIDLARFQKQEARSSQLAARSSFHVGCVARLSKEKGVDVLIDAVTDVPETDLTIVGTGTEEAYLRTLIIERSLSNVRIVRHVDDLGAFYASLDLCVLPSSDHDPFGLVAAEAMAAGVPTIVTDMCGIADYLNNGTDAVVVPAGNSSMLHRSIRTLMADETQRAALAENGRRAALERFGEERMVEAYEKLLASR